jgi:hypothetical protein
MSTEKLFEASRLPPRDENGWTVHPDLDDRWNMPGNHELFNLAAFADAGLEIAMVELEHDVTDDMHPAYVEYYEEGNGFSKWQPSLPKGDGWLLAGIWDAEDSPVAFYVRPKSADVPE